LRQILLFIITIVYYNNCLNVFRCLLNNNKNDFEILNEHFGIFVGIAIHSTHNSLTQIVDIFQWSFINGF